MRRRERRRHLRHRRTALGRPGPRLGRPARHHRRQRRLGHRRQSHRGCHHHRRIHRLRRLRLGRLRSGRSASGGSGSSDSASSGSGSSDADTSSGSVTTDGSGSLLGGNQGLVSIDVPVTVGGNAVSVIGDSTTSDATTSSATSDSAPDATTDGSDSIGGGNQAVIPVQVPVTVGGNAVSIIGDSTPRTPPPRAERRIPQRMPPPTAPTACGAATRRSSRYRCR